MTQNTLWIRFFKAKYIKWGHVATYNLQVLDSLLWRKLLECFPDLLNNSKWKVKEGNVTLWYDNFLSSGSLCEEFAEGDHLKSD